MAVPVRIVLHTWLGYVLLYVYEWCLLLQIDDYYCECNPALPLTGHLCSEPVDVCASQPCRNGARCVNEGFAYRCVCPANTAGEDCSRVIRPCDNNPCKHGSCISKSTVCNVKNCPTPWWNWASTRVNINISWGIREKSVCQPIPSSNYH